MKSRVVSCLALLGITVTASGWLGAQPAPTSAPAKPAPVAVTNAPPIAPNKPVVAGPAAVAVPPPMPDTFDRYGKILAPSDDVEHPVRLNVQFPGVGMMKIPSQTELDVRNKLERLATLSDDDIRAQLALWPPYAKMKLGEEGQMLMHIQQFKEQRTRIALQKAHDIGLTLTPQQKDRFEKDYWDKQLQMDRDLARQFEPVMKAREQKMSEELFREFSTPPVAGTPAPKPPAPVIAQAPMPASAPAAAPAPMSTPPVAQAPMR